MEVEGATTNETIEDEAATDFSLENAIIDTVYLGDIGQEGEEGTELNPYKSIQKAYEKLQLQKEDGTTVLGTIIIKGTAEIPAWATGESANKNVIIKGYDADSKIVMSADWSLQGETTITDVNIIATKADLHIYANGYNLILGTEGNNESLKTENENNYYPTVYGGSAEYLISSTNVTINGGIYQNIYGGSFGKDIDGSTNLVINYAVVNESVYGGSYGGVIGGNVETKINGGVYNISKVPTALSGGSKKYSNESININGNISGNVTFTIENSKVEYGYITGAAGSNNLGGKITLNIKEVTLCQNGIGNNKIFGFGYTGYTVANEVEINIDTIHGQPECIVGYSSLAVSESDITTNVTMNLSNIENTNIYGGTYNPNRQKINSTINMNNVQANLMISLEDTNYKDVSIKGNSNITINNEKNIVFSGILTGDGTGTLKLLDNSNLTVEGGIEGILNIDIAEDSNNETHYVDILSKKLESDEGYKLVSSNYDKKFINESISHWKFYKGDVAMQSNEKYVYLHATLRR